MQVFQGVMSDALGLSIGRPCLKGCVFQVLCLLTALAACWREWMDNVGGEYRAPNIIAPHHFLFSNNVGDSHHTILLTPARLCMFSIFFCIFFFLSLVVEGRCLAQALNSTSFGNSLSQRFFHEKGRSDYSEGAVMNQRGGRAEDKTTTSTNQSAPSD